MSEITLDGARLDSLRKQMGLTQKELAAKCGISKFTMCRWCKVGQHSIRTDNAQQLASALDMSLQALLRTCGGNGNGSSEVLTAQERDWLEAYRAMPPLEQARVRLEIEKIIQGQASSGTQPR